MFGSWIRRTAFWALDTVKGGKVRKQYQDIELKMKGERQIDQALADMLQYALAHVPRYQGKSYTKLSDFPVITKKDIMAAYDDSRSDEFRNNEELHEVATSGSSGNPFHAFQNADKRNRVIAELMYIHDQIGWRIGDRYMFMRAWTSHYNSMGFQRFKQNFIPVEVTGFGKPQMDEMRATLKRDQSIRVIIGYSSSLAELAKYMLEDGDKPEMFSVKVIVADSDALTPEGKQMLEKVFGCPVISRYDNEEQGILAYTKPYSDEYVVNTASYYMEILALDGDYPVQPGETGRIVLTDMYNRAMPFIRYDTGDLAVAGRVENGRCFTLHSLQGRVADVIFALDGSTIYSVPVNNYFCDFYDVKRYQLIQKAKGVFELLMVCPPDSPAIKSIDENLRKLLGRKIELNIRLVDDIPNGKNGKFKPWSMSAARIEGKQTVVCKALCPEKTIRKCVYAAV